jgi:hypothetical protein
VPSPNATPARLDPTTKVQIEMRIDEAARAWFDKAMGCRQNDPNAPPPFPEFCVDESLLDSAKTSYAFRPAGGVTIPSFAPSQPSPTR